MTIAGRREPRFSDITKVRNLGTKFYAMSGKRQTVIIAQNNNGLAEVVSETPNLGAEARDVTYVPATPNTLFILTDDGSQIVDSAPSVPVLGTKSAFDPGDGRWILATSTGSTKYIVTPVDGGVQVLDQAGARTSVSDPVGAGGCRDAVIGSDDVVYGVDEQHAKIHVWRVTSGKALYIDSFRAKNCRDVVKVVLDPAANILFVQCKHRIVGFNVSPAGTADEAISVTLRQDYGSLKAEYTDFVKVGTDSYWIGVDADSALNPAPEFYGRPYGAWDTPNSLLFTAFPDVSLFAASNVVPYVGEIRIPDVPVIVVPPPIIVIPPPPVVTPAAPVITSSLTASVTEDTVFNYVITATGTGPITYSVVSPPSWLTGINHVTGAISGIPADPGTFNVTIRATNAGGSDTETLVVTVTNAIGDLSAVRVSGLIFDSWLDRVNYKLYIIGGGTTLTDASGATARNNAGCLDLRTGLWTLWAPTLSSGNGTIWSAPGLAWVYIGGATGVNGSPGGSTRRVDKTTGASDAAFGIADTGVDFAVESGGNIWAGPSVSLCRLHTSTGGVDTVGSTPGVDMSQYVRGAASTPFEAATNCGPQAVTSAGEVVCVFTGSLSRGGGAGSPPYRARGVGLADSVTGIVAQATVGPASTGIRVENDILNGKMIASGIMTEVQNMSLTPVQTGLNNICILAQDLSTFYPFGVTFVSATTQRCGALDPDSSNTFIASQITSVSGDSSRRGVFKMDSAGGLVTAFNPVWSSTPDILRVVAIGGALFVMGSWSAAVTINGQARANFAVLRTDTGALY